MSTSTTVSSFPNVNHNKVIVIMFSNEEYDGSGNRRGGSSYTEMYPFNTDFLMGMISMHTMSLIWIGYVCTMVRKTQQVVTMVTQIIGVIAM